MAAGRKKKKQTLKVQDSILIEKFLQCKVTLEPEDNELITGISCDSTIPLLGIYPRVWTYISIKNFHTCPYEHHLDKRKLRLLREISIHLRAWRKKIP